MINKGLLVMGIVLAAVAVIGFFVVGFATLPPATIVIAARQEIPAGTRINELSEEMLVRIPLRGDRKLISSMLTEEDLITIRTLDGVFIQNIAQFEPLRKSALVSSGNDAAYRIPSLRLDDPNLAIIVIPVVNVPEGVRSGDKVDLVLAVSDLGTSNTTNFVQPLTTFPFDSPDGETGLVDAATPTPTATPAHNPPLAKVIVHGAEITRVVRERSVTAVNSDGSSSLVFGEILALEVVIPVDAIEWVSMATASGQLQVALLSPLVANDMQGPTLGASLSDFLDLFYKDRELLATPNANQPSPVLTPTVTTP